MVSFEVKLIDLVKFQMSLAYHKNNNNYMWAWNFDIMGVT